jgi:hypothetical protein
MYECGNLGYYTQVSDSGSCLSIGKKDPRKSISRDDALQPGIGTFQVDRDFDLLTITRQTFTIQRHATRRRGRDFQRSLLVTTERRNPAFLSQVSLVT